MNIFEIIQETMKQRKIRKQNRYEMEIVSVSLEEGFSKESDHRVFGKSNQKVIVLILLLLGFSVNGFAQFQWGIKLGVNSSTQSEVGNICDNSDLRLGFNGGVVAKYQMKDWLALKSGLDYQLKGMKCDVSGEDYNLKTKLNYLVLPVKVEFSAGEKAGFKNGQHLFFATGPYWGYLLDAKQIVNGQTTDLNDFEDLDFGWTFELGFEFPVMRSNVLQVSLNYDMGIKEIANNADFQNKTASLNLGFLF